MIKRDWNLLFSEYDLRDSLQNQLDSVGDKVRSIDPARFDTNTDDFLAASVASELVVSQLELLEDEISVSSRDAKVDVSRDPNRDFFEPGPHYVDGLEVTYHLPYVGESQLLRSQPSQFTLNPPRAVIGSDELTFPYDQADRAVAATKTKFEEDLTSLKRWLPRVNEQVAEYNASLESRISGLVKRRREELTKTKDDLAGLGYAVDGDKSSGMPAAPTPEDVAVRRAAKREESRREYDVALSFAGEDREYVERVAEVLVELGVSVFYDRFETVNLWGKDLADHLGQIYSTDSHFVVMFASRNYAKKAWPNHERQFALSRHLKGDVGRILPVRIDDTEIPGVAPTIGYLDARALSAEKLAELIRQKLDAE